MKVIAWLISWLLYWAGHLTSVIMHSADVFGYLYPLYNRLMIWSFSVQCWADNESPWRRSDER